MVDPRTIDDVSGDIAHDLRAPLARLRSQLAVLARQAHDAALRAGLEAALAQTDAMLAMVSAMLRIVEVEGGTLREGFVPIDLGALAEEVGGMMRPVTADAGHELAIGPCAAAPIMGNRQLLAQALINLIENALRHTLPGTHIRITADARGASAVLAVEDDGPGIPIEHVAEALRRLGRLDRSRGDAGHGLGLPLVETIARAHGGTLAMENAEPGLRVVLAIPLASER